MNELPVHKRGYQADVHFALGAVIQGITVAALGAEIAAAIKSFDYPASLWIFATGLLSFTLCLTFWVNFINNFFFGFRVVALSAKMHILFSAQYLLLGLLQLMAIHFLANPKIWLTFYVLLFIVAFLGSWYLSRNMVVLGDEEIRSAYEYDPGGGWFIGLFAITFLLLVVWYVFPTVDTLLFRGFVLLTAFVSLIVFNLNFNKIFQRHLETG
jgi:hypothetical protein